MKQVLERLSPVYNLRLKYSIENVPIRYFIKKKKNHSKKVFSLSFFVAHMSFVKVVTMISKKIKVFCVQKNERKKLDDLDWSPLLALYCDLSRIQFILNQGSQTQFYVRVTFLRKRKVWGLNSEVRMSVMAITKRKKFSSFLIMFSSSI